MKKLMLVVTLFSLSGCATYAYPTVGPVGVGVGVIAPAPVFLGPTWGYGNIPLRYNYPMPPMWRWRR